MINSALVAFTVVKVVSSSSVSAVGSEVDGTEAVVVDAVTAVAPAVY